MAAKENDKKAEGGVVGLAKIGRTQYVGQDGKTYYYNVVNGSGKLVHVGQKTIFIGERRTNFRKSAGRVVVVGGKKFVIGERKIKKTKHSPRKSAKKSGQKKKKRSQRKSH